MNEWQPIETAPMDGTVVLVGRDMGECWGFVRGYGHYEDLGGGVCGWISQGFSEPPGNLGLGNPTHWKPLPDSPREQDDERNSSSD